MRNAIILHGTSETKDSFWFPWLAKELEARGYEVSVPALPDADAPDLAKWLPRALQEAYGPETAIIAHSVGCALALSVLEELDTKIDRAILVAGRVRAKGDAELERIFQERYDWKKIADNVGRIVLLNSDNDPWGFDDGEGAYIKDQLGKGELIVMKGEGHMGSDKFDQPYKEFPFLLEVFDRGSI